MGKLLTIWVKNNLIKRIEITNFTSIKSLKLPEDTSKLLELPNGLFIIRGPNSTGKTNLVKAILWGIWGGIKGRGQCGIIDESNDRIIRIIGQDSEKSSSTSNKCAISFEFEISNERYNIERKKTRGKTSNVVLTRIEGETEVDTITGFDKTCEKLQEIFNCTSKDIVNTFYVRQGEVDYLATRTPTELRNHFEMLFKLKDFTQEIKDGLNKRIKDTSGEVRLLEKEKNEILQQQEKLDYIKDQKVKDEEKLKDMEIKNEKIEKIIKTYPDTKDIKDLKDLLEEKEKFSSKLIDHNKMLEMSNEKIKDSEAIIEQKKLEKERLSGQLDKNQELIKQFPSLKAIKSLNEKYQAIKILDTSYNNNIKDFSDVAIKKFDLKENEKISNIINLVKLNNNESETLKKELESRDKSKNEEKLEINKKISKYTALIDDLKEKIKLLSEKDECPTCLTPFEHEKHKKDVLGRIKNTIEKYKKDLNGFKIKEKEIENELMIINREVIENEKNLKILNHILTKIETLSESKQEIKQKKQDLKGLLDQLGEESLELFLSKYKISSLEDFLIEIEKKQQENAHLLDGLDKISREIHDHGNKLIENREENSEIQDNILRFEESKEKTTNLLNKLITKLKIEDIPLYLKKFKVDSLDKLNEKIIFLNNIRDSFVQNIKEIKDVLKNLDSEINKIEDKIKKLDQIKKEISDKEKIINHLDIIRLQYLDKFISQEVIQNKLFQSIKREVSNYLLKFSDGQYIFKEIKSARQKGVEFELHDNVDNIDKTMDLLSGGDKAVFGLALRIGLSNLMARIRPFKTSETKPISFNILILDEPLSNIDEIRRQMVVKHLKDDKSFAQIFLITHTPETEDEKFNHRIFVSKTREQGSKYKLFPSILLKTE